MSARKPDAYCIHKTNGDILCLVRTEERARAWQNDVPNLPVIPLYRRTPEDVQTLLAAIPYIEICGRPQDYELAAKLRAMAGE